MVVVMVVAAAKLADWRPAGAAGSRLFGLRPAWKTKFPRVDRHHHTECACSLLCPAFLLASR